MRPSLHRALAAGGLKQAAKTNSLDKSRLTSWGDNLMKKFAFAVLLLNGFNTGVLAEDLIYAYNAGGEHQAYILNLETGEDRQIALGNGVVWNAAFSPDDTRIIYSLQTDAGRAGGLPQKLMARTGSN